VRQRGSKRVGGLLWWNFHKAGLVLRTCKYAGFSGSLSSYWMTVLLTLTSTKLRTPLSSRLTTKLRHSSSDKMFANAWSQCCFEKNKNKHVLPCRSPGICHCSRCFCGGSCTCAGKSRSCSCSSGSRGSCRGSSRRRPAAPRCPRPGATAPRGTRSGLRPCRRTPWCRWRSSPPAGPPIASRRVSRGCAWSWRRSASSSAPSSWRTCRARRTCSCSRCGSWGRTWWLEKAVRAAWTPGALTYPRRGRQRVDPADPRVALVLFGDAAGLELAVLRLDDVGQVDAGALAREDGGGQEDGQDEHLTPPATV
jgi:hypothetical protein